MAPRTALRRFALASFLALSLASPALAQHTGGSFGGGHFGGSHSSGGSHSYGGSRSYGSHSYGSHSYGSRSYGSRSYGGSSGGSPCCTVFFMLIVVGIVIAAKSIENRAHRQGGMPGAGYGSPAAGLGARVDVSAIMIALDWNARPELQSRLDQLARSGQTNAPHGLAFLLHETIVALRRHETSWLYAGAVNALPSSVAEAEATFRRVAQEARSRYRVETIRAMHGTTLETQAPELRARAEEGAGVVVVTVVVAARHEIPDIAKATDANQLRNLMRAIGGLPAQSIVALEVIWSPAVETDRMSTAELEVLYPELRRIEEHTIAGRVFCGYCGSPFAHELSRCPHCGGPATDARPRNG